MVYRRYFYRVSVRSLFILASLEDTDKSMVRSPISTTRPPRISGFTSLVTFSFLPGPTYWDLETAASRRDRVRASSDYTGQLGSTSSLTYIYTVGDSVWEVACLCGRHNHLDLATGSAHELGELVADTLQKAQAVVLSESGEEVLDGVVGAGGADALLELGHDGALVAVGQRRRGEDNGELGVPGEQVAESGDGLRGRFEGRGLHGRRVLDVK